LTATSVSRDEEPAAADRSWHISLLTRTEPGARNRRTIDSVVLAGAAVFVGLSAAIAAAAPAQDEAIARALTTVLGWAAGLWQTLFVLVLVLVLALVTVVDVLVRRRWDLARDVVAAAVILLAAAPVLGGVVESNWVPAEAHVLSRWGYPELRLAGATAALVVVGPELVRPVRLLAAWLIPFAAFGAAVFGAAEPSAALGALALGLSAGSLVRLIFGTAAGMPPKAAAGDFTKLKDQVDEADRTIKAAVAKKDAELKDMVDEARKKADDRAAQLGPKTTDAVDQAQRQWNQVQSDWDKHVKRIRERADAKKAEMDAGLAENGPVGRGRRLRRRHLRGIR
jgi:hypothetical protein